MSRIIHKHMQTFAYVHQIGRTRILGTMITISLSYNIRNYLNHTTLSFWWKHTIVLINVCGKLYNGTTTEWYHGYMGSEWDITPFNFHWYALAPYLSSNAKALHISQLWHNPWYLKKVIFIYDLGLNCVYKLTL